jgi:hypothetical protein
MKIAIDRTALLLVLIIGLLLGVIVSGGDNQVLSATEDGRYQVQYTPGSTPSRIHFLFIDTHTGEVQLFNLSNPGKAIETINFEK